MNKQQTKVVAVMLALAILIAAIVLVRDRAPGADTHARQEHGEEHGHAEEGEEHHDNGVIRFTDAQIEVAGITLAKAGPVHLDTFIRMPGQIALNQDRTAHVTPRAQGAVEDVEANLGDQVRKGQVLAIVASAEVAAQRAALAAAERRVAYARGIHASERTLFDENISARQDLLKAEQELFEAQIARDGARQQLQALGADSGGTGGGTGGGTASNRLTIRAPFDGAIVEKHITLGEIVGADTRVFTIADLSTVWAEVVVPARDLDLVRVGTDAVIRSIASNTTAPGKVGFVSALVGVESRSARARVVLDNPGVAWRPGLAVNVDIVTGSSDVPVAVAQGAIQNQDGRQIVYKRVAEGFVAQPVAIGRSDGRFTEITAGLVAGDAYAAAGSFAVKAEQGKGEGGHEH